MTTQPMLNENPPRLSTTARAMQQAWFTDETEHVRMLRKAIPLDAAAQARIAGQAAELVGQVRDRSEDLGPLDAFMQEYDLSSEEGVVLMCLAEALLRIPDDETAEKLIADKLADADWESHLGKSTSMFVNASTWGLMLTGRMFELSQSTQRNFRSVVGRLANRSGEPVVRLAVRQAMKIMGHQYVMGRSIKSALERSRKKGNREYRYSFDMLGEAALTAEDAERYFEAYLNAINAIGTSTDIDDIYAAPSISVKLSALHPRYEHAQRERVLQELSPKLLQLAECAARNNIALTMDAEEAERLMLSLEVFAEVAKADSIRGWNGLGLAIQAYQKRCWYLLDWLEELAGEADRRFPVRLVKGAYWDSEIKLAQMEGWPGYPVFSRKVSTDLSYIACAAKLLNARRAFYPQFATHNAHTIATIRELAGERLDYEYQRLHGMGTDLYGAVKANKDLHGACRVYAPVGSHEDLLPYLVRRLLENGANTSFVNRISDERLAVSEVAGDPMAELDTLDTITHSRIPLPAELYGSERRNSDGVPLSHELVLEKLREDLSSRLNLPLEAGPRIAGGSRSKHSQYTIADPAQPQKVVGYVSNATEDDVAAALDTAAAAFTAWDATPVEERAQMLEKAADALQEHQAWFMSLATCEGGKTVRDTVAEVREAIDFLRYYAVQARKLFGQPETLPGPTGESNQLGLAGRGVFVCISPWNFPLAIFTGQISAALVAGNPVIAKPAEQTPLIADAMVQLLHQAGVPENVLQLLPGDGATVGAQLTRDERVIGVAFTGSTDTARIINRSLAARESGPLPALIAETGGQNAMVVDSSALPEQVVKDVISSAFLSAGQRCSALRVLYVQNDVAERMLEMLRGAMAELRLGLPGLLNTDVGPVIDREALQVLQAHRERMLKEGREIATTPVPDDLPGGYFFPPCAFEIDKLAQLEREVFGPVLHVIRYRSRDLDQVISDINAAGYGLTLGIHSRIDRVQNYIAGRVRVGNTYVNRNMTGAVVGVQPFGGEGLSGTGPKAGGPHYLLRFATERTLTINTAAVGGNASLLAMSDESET